MFKSVDILIGFSVIMLVVSISVTMVNQIITSILNLRGLQLRAGVWRLLRYIDHGIDEGSARVLANLVLKDPIVATRRFTGFRLASVIQREELTVLLMRIAAGDATELNVKGLEETYQDPPERPEPANDAERQTWAAAELKAHVERIDGKINPLIDTCTEERKKPGSWIWRAFNRLTGNATDIEKLIAIYQLRKSICQNGLPNLHQTLKDIRGKVLELEASSPSKSSSVRQNEAILDCADSDYIARLNSWFDQTIDRVSEAFTASSLFWTLLASAIIACVMQLDSVAILNRLSVDDTYRSALVTAAVKNPTLARDITDNFESVQGRPTAATAAAAKADSAQDSAQAALLDSVRINKIIELPNYGKAMDWSAWLRALPGMLLSAALLSLGGPFWYEMLKNLLKLRSVLATKDDVNRKERQTTQPDPSKLVT